ncbi:MAG: hypothetical protein WCP10_07485 [Desulfuromonadales bacterium]
MKVAKLALCSTLLLLLPGHSFAQQQDIGIFYQNEKNCRIKQNNEWGACKKGLMVAEGDIIEVAGDASALGVQWVAPPFTHVEKISPNQFKAVFARPAGKRTMVSSISNILGFGRSGGNEGQYHVTRSIVPGDTRINIQSPGQMATLLPGVEVPFSWCGFSSARFTVVHEKSGIPVFTRDISGRQSFSVTPETMGLQSGVRYSWSVEGIKEPLGHLVLLGKESAAEITDGLKDIEKAAASRVEKKLKQAAYLNFLSETYPDGINLYWRSLELLTGMEKENGTAELARKLGNAAREKMVCLDLG